MSTPHRRIHESVQSRFIKQNDLILPVAAQFAVCSCVSPVPLASYTYLITSRIPLAHIIPFKDRLFFVLDRYCLVLALLRCYAEHEVAFARRYSISALLVYAHIQSFPHFSESGTTMRSRQSTGNPGTSCPHIVKFPVLIPQQKNNAAVTTGTCLLMARENIQNTN